MALRRLAFGPQLFGASENAVTSIWAGEFITPDEEPDRLMPSPWRMMFGATVRFIVCAARQRRGSAAVLKMFWMPQSRKAYFIVKIQGGGRGI